MTKEQKQAFEMGWRRSGRAVNHASRRQYAKAQTAGRVDEFVAGWYAQQVLAALFGPNATHVRAEDNRE